MDTSWIKNNRWTREYLQGVTQFLDFACENSMADGLISCPCLNCANAYNWSREIVHDHLMCNGISRNYSNWYFYGELIPKVVSSKANESHTHQVPRVSSEMHDMLRDIFQMHNEVRDEFEDGNNFEMPPMETSKVHEQPRQGPNEDAKKFYDLLKDAEHPLYNGCEKYSKLSAIVTLYHIKCLNKWSNKSFTMLLEVLKNMLPQDATLPNDCYDAKKYIKDLGLGYEKIHACPNNCVLFWKENESAVECPKCHVSRWQTVENDAEAYDDIVRRKKPAKVLRWFPLKPRLQRLFMSSKTAPLMKWHVDGRQDDGMMRHPADSAAWKHFDSKHVDFSLDPRNVRLGLASDGFNPFGNMSTSYSIWPVILIPYNLPPWVCMKRSSFILSLLIPGPSPPSTNIDVFLQPLIEELNSLWEIGLDTYDISSNETFQMRAALLWTINDFPAYGDLSGWSTKGGLACPSCNYDTHSRWLKHGGKYCYMRHRRFLSKNHRFRRDRVSFDGTTEMEGPTSLLSGTEILQQTEGINAEKGKRKRDRTEELNPWKKRSIFFTLPYWEHLLLRHNLDMMHIEKNVCDNILGTLLNVKGKTKDNWKARMDLEDMGIRRELHIQDGGADKLYIPHAIFVMTQKEKDGFLKVLKNVKVPDGYSSNLSRCIQLKQRKIVGMKSHDCHILMQQLLAIALRGALPKKVTAPLIDLCCIFRELCSKVLHTGELEQLQSRSAETLCHLEKIFPPSFFTIMVHLVIHLANEANIGGPVHYRWMYSVERYLFLLKSYVKNKAHPEGSIAEGYLAEECLTFCSRYLDNVETVFNRPSRTNDDSIGSVLNIELDQKTWIQAHRYVLFNSDEITPFRSLHRDAIKRQNRGSRMSDAVINKIHMETFVDWFQSYVVRLDDGRDECFTDKIRWLARGPNTSCNSFRGYVVNGIKFRTKEYEKSRKTQNSGVCVESEGGITYYGILMDIFELNYFDKLKYVLFRCNWADINKGHKIDDFGFTLVNFSRLIHTGKHLTDEPFVLATQARQVYYVEDERHENWLVVVKTKPREVFDMGGSGTCEDEEDSYCDNEPYNIRLQSMSDNIQDNINWTRVDAEGDLINKTCLPSNLPSGQEDLDEFDSENDL